jgi:DMSO reductase family type II enzyme chaperone
MWRVKTPPHEPSNEEVTIPIDAIKRMQNLLILRQILYRFFSLLFLYPDNETMNDLLVATQELLSTQEYWEKQPYAETLSALLKQLSRSSKEYRKKIIDEYNRLFLINPRVSPYETTYVNSIGKSSGNVVAEISGIYAQAGLAVSPKFNDLPDHIAIELEFMSFLCEKELQGMLESNGEATAVAQQEQRDFLDRHLAFWFPQFTKKVLSETNEQLYKNVIEAAFSFLRNELALAELKPAR